MQVLIYLVIHVFALATIAGAILYPDRLVIASDYGTLTALPIATITYGLAMLATYWRPRPRRLEPY